MDNFYIIEEQYNSVVNELSLNEYIKMPSVNGISRIYLIAMDLVKYTDGYITEEIIENFVKSYQSKLLLA